jgi:hypothetical protein
MDTERCYFCGDTATHRLRSGHPLCRPCLKELVEETLQERDEELERRLDRLHDAWAGRDKWGLPVTP